LTHFATAKRAIGLLATLALLIALFTCAGLTTSSRAASATLSGRVTHVANGQPLPGVRVGAGGIWVRTDRQGRYELPLPPGQYALRAEFPGYIGMTRTRVQIGVSAPSTVDLAMFPESPTAEESAQIDRLFEAVTQALPNMSELESERGFGLSAIAVPPATLRVLMPDGTVVAMPMDEYLKGVVPAEMPPYWPSEALKAQAIAARSYASTRRAHLDVGAEVCTTVHCQVWTPTHYDTTDAAVEATHGVVATYAGSVISAFFYAHCDGHTRNSEDVWGGYLPYCRSVACPCGFDYMYGHGVGMCQHGAKVLAETGSSSESIVQYYYTGVSVRRPQTAELSNPQLSPVEGDTATPFHFQVSYAHEIGDLPIVANVLVDGRAYALHWVPGTTSPRVYGTTLRLPEGTHGYRYVFDDGYAPSVSLPTTGSIDGPLVSGPGAGLPTPTVPAPLSDGGIVSQCFGASADWADGQHVGTAATTDGGGQLTLAAGASSGTFTSNEWVLDGPYVAVGARWVATVPDTTQLTIQARTSLGEGHWSDWKTFQADHDGHERHGLVTGMLRVVAGDRLQVRAEMATESPGLVPHLSNLELIAISSADHLDDPKTVAPDEVVPREVWGAEDDVSNWPPEPLSPSAVVLHQAGFSTDGVSGPAAVRALYAYHRIVKEHGDLAYNYVVDASGTVYEGRQGSAATVGAHAGMYSYATIGIGLLGDLSTMSEDNLTGLARFLAWQCRDRFWHPNDGADVLGQLVPVIASHSQLETRSCADASIVFGLQALRDRTLGEMGRIPPNVRITSPHDGDLSRAVVAVELQTSPVITQLDCLVDGSTVLTIDEPPYVWKWSSAQALDGDHELAVLVSNGAGSAADSISVRVDNRPPVGSVTGPDWTSTRAVELAVSSADASEIQFSNDWVFEGEQLYHQAGTGSVIEDASALNGTAWRGVAGTDAPGAWYGPYLCGLPARSSYDVYYRLKTPSRHPFVGIATLDIVDNQCSGTSGRTYATRPLMSSDLALDNTFEGIRLSFLYGDKWPTCEDSEASDGIEFRTWFASTADLVLDRVAVFSKARAMAPLQQWTLADRQGQQTVIARLLDSAGNATDVRITIGLDQTPPTFYDGSRDTIWAQDALSGLDLASAAFTLSTDNAQSWGAWQPIDLPPDTAITEPVMMRAASVSGTHVRFQIADRLGLLAISDPQPLTASNTPTPTATAAPSETLPAPTLPPPTIGPVPTTQSSALPLVYKGANLGVLFSGDD